MADLTLRQMCQSRLWCSAHKRDDFELSAHTSFLCYMLELPRYGLVFDTILLLPHILPFVRRVHSPDEEAEEFKRYHKNIWETFGGESTSKSASRLGTTECNSSAAEVNNTIKCKPVETGLQSVLRLLNNGVCFFRSQILCEFYIHSTVILKFNCWLISLWARLARFTNRRNCWYCINGKRSQWTDRWLLHSQCFMGVDRVGFPTNFLASWLLLENVR